ncbi:MAG: ATP-grasp domain-containing protein [Halobacteriovoraceae bacterium]|nr:ATP-grasp domain-containing protein [Halobacteriovoraceae bacterium]
MKKILIINRGEIAIRVAKAINELGHISVGLWTDNEPEAAHLEYCQQWVHLPGKNNTETYLNQEKILEIIEQYNVDAVHPGYGFLAENGEFVEKLEKKKVIFIGPNAKAIELMGDKAVSKKMAEKAGVPTIPGSVGEVDSVKEAKDIAKKIGYPVLLKAVAGGGGKGMRACFSEDELEKNFEAVKREALSSFSNDGLLVEKYILNPHHIEVQVLGDKQGNIYHLYERECSVQRRHQKIIEEAPSPFIGDDQALRKAICETAIKLAREVNYDSAGTVEFIMDEDRSFYFLEMNTRIQVEHPITEEVTGVDLLVNMIKVALNEPIDFQKQDDISLHGHAIECRICAEDPVTMLPAPGKISGISFTFPQGIRFDHCLYAGQEITPSFDPMIGKLVAKGLHRSACLSKMRSALKGLKIEGLKNNIPLHQKILSEKQFVSGIYSTKYIEEVKPQESLENENIFDKVVNIIAGEVNL